MGGTQIEAWLSNATLKKSCTNQTGGKPATSWVKPGNGALYNGMILPLVNFTIRGALWYQGENNCAECDAHYSKDNSSNVCGNVLNNTGYPCYLKSMVNEWRGVWSAEPGTTDPSFPFGVFTLASTEGRCGDGGFRHAQTLNYGVLPSPDLPNSFVAQGFDAQDPVGISNWPQGERGCRAFGWNSAYSMGGGDNNQAIPWTPFFMGPIHPRPKHILGRRMAVAATAIVYGDKEIDYTGPVIANCSVGPRGVTINFNETLLRSDAVKVFPPIGNHPKYGAQDLFPQQAASLCGQLPNGSLNPLCSTFGGITPMEVEYTVEYDNGTRVSVWIPVGKSHAGQPCTSPACVVVVVMVVVVVGLSSLPLTCAPAAPASTLRERARDPREREGGREEVEVA